MGEWDLKFCDNYMGLVGNWEELPAIGISHCIQSEECGTKPVSWGNWNCIITVSSGNIFI